MGILKEMADAVVTGDKEACAKLADKAIKEDLDPIEAIQEGFAKGMEVVGNNFECGKIYLPEMMSSAKAMNAGVEILEPALAAKGPEGVMTKGKIILATVQGDMHDIGKNIVKLIMSTAGFEIIDLGRNVKVERIIDEAQDKKADIIALSALMTTTMGYMPVLIEELTEMGFRQDSKVMVGGAPVTEKWAKQIGADGYARDAVGAVKVAKELVKNKIGK
ncbi:MAG: corrinoid protein [Gammaproteobacteria bacterium]|nr:corrinoid protein [Gammaproteobacteria bacterium]